jgi:hypothetical protein
MHRSGFVLRFALIATALVGCKTSTTDTTSDKSGSQAAASSAARADAQVNTTVESYFPTAVGAKWKWRTKTTIGDNTGPLKPTVLTDTSESRIAGHEDINGVKCLRIEIMDRSGNLTQTEHLSIAADGHYRSAKIKIDFFRPSKYWLCLPKSD